MAAVGPAWEARSTPTKIGAQMARAAPALRSAEPVPTMAPTSAMVATAQTIPVLPAIGFQVRYSSVSIAPSWVAPVELLAWWATSAVEMPAMASKAPKNARYTTIEPRAMRAAGLRRPRSAAHRPVASAMDRTSWARWMPMNSGTSLRMSSYTLPSPPIGWINAIVAHDTAATARTT